MNYEEELKIYERAKRIIESDLEWREKYDMIFSEEISRKVKFDYYDPDCDYEDDTMAFYKAFSKWNDCDYDIFPIKIKIKKTNEIIVVNNMMEFPIGVNFKILDD